MALFRGDIRSETLQLDTSLSVILPYDRPVSDQPRPCKVLYLLHGIKLNSTGWTRWTNLETFAKNTGIAVVAPEAYRGFYTDMVYGPAYFTFFAEELPKLCREMFGISSKREDTYVAGLSMGGYGALKLALRRPDVFSAAAGLSTVCDPIAFATAPELGGPLTIREAPSIWGTGLTLKPEDDLHVLAKQAAGLPQEQRPRLYMCCGAQDSLYSQNIILRNELRALPMDFSWEEWDGVHDWAFWEEAVQRALAFFLNR